MSTSMTLFDPKQNPVPAHLRDDDWTGNTTAPVTIPSLLYTGKVWTISVNGEKTRLMRKDQDGDEAPLATLKVILLDFAAKRGRSYYEGAYDPGATTAPACWSDDGVLPAAAVAAPQAKSCANCQWSVKGSKVTEQGKDTTACSQHRMLALVPAFKPDMEPLRLKIAITSDWDKSPDLAAQNYFAFQQYQNFLNGRGVNHTAKVITKMRFDPAVAYPKVIFSPDRWLTPEEVAVVKPILGTTAVTRLLGESFTPDGAEGTSTEDTSAPITPARPEPKPEPKPSLADDDGDGVILQGGTAPAAAQQTQTAPAPTTTRAPRQPKAQPAATTTATTLPGWGDDEDAAPAAAAQAEQRPVAAKPAAESTVPASVESVLADWGDN